MPKFNVTSPDGKSFVINAPDGATQDQVLAYAQSKFKQPTQDKGTFKGSALGGIVQGLRDPIDAGAQMLSHALPDSVSQGINNANNWLADKTGLVGKLPEGGIDQSIKQNEQSYQQDRANNGRSGFDAARITGNVIGTAPLALIPGGQTLGANVASGAAVGGISGALQPVREGDFADEKLKQAELGLATGGALGLAGKALSKMIAPETRPEAKVLLDQNVKLTPGQILGGLAQKVEDKAQSIPFLGDMISNARGSGVEDLNRAAYIRALKGTNVDANTLPVGREGIATVKDAVSKQYNELLPKLSFKPDQKFNAELSNLRNMAKGLGEKEANKFNSIIDDALSKTSPNGGMAGETYKIVESKLGTEAKKFSSSTDAYQKELGDALSEASRVFKSGLERSNPQYAKELAQANSNYANYARLRNAGQMTGDQSGGFSAAQLASAVKSSDKSVGKGNVSMGKALMQDLSDPAIKVMGNKVADSGTAGRLMLAGGLGTAAYMNPALIAAGGVASLPYTKIGQKIAQALLTQRPAGANSTAKTLAKTLPLLSGSFIPAQGQ